MAAGVKAYAWLSALGLETAQGAGFSIARIAAEGPVAFAKHANDSIAHRILAESSSQHTQTIFLILIAVLSLVPVASYARAVRQRLGGRPSSGEMADG